MVYHGTIKSFYRQYSKMQYYIHTHTTCFQLYYRYIYTGTTLVVTAVLPSMPSDKSGFQRVQISMYSLFGAGKPRLAYRAHAQR